MMCGDHQLLLNRHCLMISILLRWMLMLMLLLTMMMMAFCTNQHTMSQCDPSSHRRTVAWYLLSR